MVNNYPFRPEAVNSIIQVDADTHEYNVLDKYSVAILILVGRRIFSLTLSRL